MGVTGQSLPPKNDFEHARGLRNSAYAVNLTYETYRQHSIFNPSEWNIGIYCTQGRNISRGHIGYSLRGTTVSVATYPLTMRSIRGGTLGWNIEIYSTPTNQFDWSVSRAYVINIYISREISIEHPSVGLASLAQ